jgi:hypothetical protein
MSGRTPGSTPSAAGQRAAAMLAGRRADSGRRRQRVLAALSHAAEQGQEISVAAISRAAGVDRTFLYRHRDLLEQVHASQAAPSAAGAGPVVTRESLQADLLSAHERAARMTAQIRQLESRLSEVLGQQAWHESGLGAPPDIDQLRHDNSQLEQQVTDLRMQLEERDQDLAAARAANRELMTQLNHTAACR